RAGGGRRGHAGGGRRGGVAGSGRTAPHRRAGALLRGGGEPYRLHHRRHGVRPRPVVLIVDISGSMSAYADALLRFAHAASRHRAGGRGGGRGGGPGGAAGGAGRAAVVTLGTRPAPGTPPLAVGDPGAARPAAAP